MNPGETSPSFIILFTDLSIILLTFLIFLNALALPDIERRANAIASVGEQFQGSLSVIGFGSKREHGIAPSLANQSAAMSFSERYGTIASLATSGGFQVTNQEDFFLLTISSDKLFTSPDKQLLATALPILRKISAELKSAPIRLRISAHSAAESGLVSPWGDSLLEAAALTRFFLDQGVRSERLEVQAHGSQNPRASTLHAEEISNHRIEILLERVGSK